MFCLNDILLKVTYVQDINKILKKNNNIANHVLFIWNPLGIVYFLPINVKAKL